MNLNFEQLKKIWSLHKELDNIIEKYQFSHRDMKSALNEVYNFLQKEINITAFFVETKNEKLINTLYNFGNCTDDIKLRAPLLETADKIVCFSLNKQVWYAQPIDVDGHKIGTIAIGLKKQDITEDTDFYSEALNAVSELLDSYFYGIHTSSIKHSLIMGLQEALSDLDINTALKRAANILYQCVHFEHMLIVYTDQNSVSENRNVKYAYFQENKQINDNNDNPSPILDRIIHFNKDCLTITPDILCKSLKLKEISIFNLSKGVYEEDSIGFICVERHQNTSLSILAQELIQIFTEELRQRLIDLNREKNILRKYFPNKVITQLITTPNYEQRFLKAKDAEIGIMFADISGFTKISEQILKTPDKITNFINKWAKGVVARMFPLGAALDKIIGDCAMFLFGPPFYNYDKETIVKHMLQGSQQIVSFTNKYLKLNNPEIINHPDFNKFGVCIGINFCHCTVGLIGPNHDLTAFSSGVNITARLQGIAEANEILVTESVKEIATSKPNQWIFSEKKSTKVKNVAQPLGYYKLISGRQE